MAQRNSSMRTRDAFWWSKSGREARLREQLYAGILSIVPAAVIAIDNDGVIIYTNEELRSLLGYEHGELIGRPLTTIIPPENRAAHLNGIARYIGGEKRHLNWDRVEVNALHGNGTTRVPVIVKFVEAELQGKKIFAAIISLRDETQWKIPFIPPLVASEATP